MIPASEKSKWKDLRKWSHFERTNDRVSGYFKGCLVNVWRDLDDFPDGDRFYAIVNYKNGSIMCDGWVPEDISTLDGAVTWALEGSLLL